MSPLHAAIYPPLLTIALVPGRCTPLCLCVEKFAVSSITYKERISVQACKIPVIMTKIGQGQSDASDLHDWYYRIGTCFLVRPSRSPTSSLQCTDPRYICLTGVYSSDEGEKLWGEPTGIVRMCARPSILRAKKPDVYGTGWWLPNISCLACSDYRRRCWKGCLFHCM